MARLPRFVLPNQPHHIIQTGNNNQPVFQDEDDYREFLAMLKTAAKQFKVAIHAYCLMPNHVHLLASPSDGEGLARMMQWMGRKYVPYFNSKYGRTGTLWAGRYKTSVVDPDEYFLPCSLYVELNPVRSGAAHTPQEYPWTSFNHHIGTRQDTLITDHPRYWSLGNTPFQREAAYTQLADKPQSRKELEFISAAVLKGWPLGSDTFKRTLEQRAKRQVLPAKRGRPRKMTVATQPDR
ncbi:transposase [Massilia arenosa]|uniref:Transposase n=1 Tax=Zemynaea arenosa TaxID=2561931 RepID=A0A4Y9RTE8_9BURK|nr:transposase [Massilia arenosa]TFW10809.1 transposase [Massilia arenosa]